MFRILLTILAITPTYAWNVFSSAKEPVQKAELMAPRKNNNPIPKCLNAKQQILENRFTCPTVKELYKVKMRWKTDSGWTSYQDSFSTSIKSFLGAQWKGVGIGRVICLYSSSDDSEFHVQIATTRLVMRPDYARWEENPRNRDTLNCVSDSSNPCDCQFSFYIEKEENDVDKIIESIRKKKPL